jgi:drug/metabolite transporter (DMT)-like permease
MLAAIALALTSAAVLGAADFFGGLAAQRTRLMTVTLTSQYTATATLVPILLLRGPHLSASSLGWAIGSGIMMAAAMPLLFGALASGPMSLVAPITSASAILPAAVGVARGALVSVATGAGLALTLVGIVVVARAAPGQGTAQRVDRRGLVLAIGAAVAIGGTNALLQAAASANAGAPLGAAAVAVGAAALTTSAIRPLVDRRHSRSAPLDVSRTAILAGGLSGAGVALFALASRPANATTVVAVLSSLYSVWTIVLARLVLHERLSRSQAGGIVCALLGVAIVSAV